MPFSSDNRRFLENFRKLHSRSPRILHIGNIANNAYLNAKILNESGFDCDVICYDYYHIMGCPEWEDGRFEGDYGDQFKPNWKTANVRSFDRPDWFVQGPLRTCIEYLIAKRAGKEKLRKILQLQLSAAAGSAPLGDASPSIQNKLSASWGRFNHWFKRGGRFALTSPAATMKIARYCDEGPIAAIARRDLVRMAIAWSLLTLVLTVRLLILPIKLLATRLKNLRKQKPSAFDTRVSELKRIFAERFPARQDALEASDLEWFRSVYCEWSRLLRHYDLVHAYSTDPIIPLLVDVPYIAFEHGTIRNIPFESTSQGRMCALSYRCSNWAVITNADNMAAARRLELENFTFVPHPVNENGIAKSSFEAESLRQALMEQLEASFIVFHPSRQHWSSARHPDWEKGNDIFLRGYARFVRQVNGNAAAVLVDWGASVDASRRLIAELGIEDKVLWVQPMPHLKMVDYIMACDLVADQFFLGAFGSTLPKALACGRPAMLYLDELIHRECFKEMPPVLNARTEDEVFDRLMSLWSSPAWGAELRLAGREWYEQYHSNMTIANHLASIYSSALRWSNVSVRGEAAACVD